MPDIEAPNLARWAVKVFALTARVGYLTLFSASVFASSSITNVMRIESGSLP